MINQAFIQEALSIPHEKQVSIVAKAIRHKANYDSYIGNRYSPSRFYLSKFMLTEKLQKMGYRRTTADNLADWIRQNIQHAYERAVFVVTDRVVGCEKDYSADTPDALIAALREKEEAYFTSTLWYPKDTYVNALRNERWCDDVAREIGPMTLLYVRAAFTRGLKDAAEHLIKPL